MVAYTLFLDRQILTLMVRPIEHDLGITETQFALLTPHITLPTVGTIRS
jgi:hypothetical protein